MNTRWCTAAKKDNMFDEYNKEGPLYIILHKPTNRRWQFHLRGQQFMDERDNDTNFIKFNKQYPIVFNKYIVFSEQEQLKAVKWDSFSIKYIRNPTEKVQLAAVKRIGRLIKFIKDPSEEIQFAAIKNDPHAIKDIKNPSEKLQLAAVKKRWKFYTVYKKPFRRSTDGSYKRK